MRKKLITSDLAVAYWNMAADEAREAEAHEWAETTARDSAEAEDEAWRAALKLFELGRISSGRSAEIADLPRIEFLLRAGQAGVPVVDLDDEEMDRESADA